MADSEKDAASEAPATRPRAPTITIDTTNDTEPPPTNASSMAPAASSPHTTPTTTHSEKPIIPREPSFESKDSRPTSPHNVSSPVAAKGSETGLAFLSVPGDRRSRQNSVDSEDGGRSVGSSIGDNTVTGTASGQPDKGAASSESADNETIMKDPNALKPDQGKEADFEVANNPFAFSPGQLTKMFNPKSLSAFYALGGLKGLEKGLRSNRETGLSVDEKHLAEPITFEEATSRSSKPADEGMSSPIEHPSVTRDDHGTDTSFSDRKRVFADNRIPEKKGKSFLELVWITYNDKVLILLSIAAVVSLAVGLYQTFAPSNHGPGVEWVEGVAIIVAIVIVVLVGSLNDWRKEKQFVKLNRKKQDRVVKVVRSGKTIEISVFDILSGDVLHLEPGDLIPVDGILIQGFNVKCDESQATGESDIIRKVDADYAMAAIENGESTRKIDPFIQSGGRVMEGVGTFMCTSTGIYSSYGKTLMSLNEESEVTPLQSKLNVIAEYIAKIGSGVALLLFVVLFILFCVRLNDEPIKTPAEKGQAFLEIFIVVVTIIVVAVPEGLPLAVTLALAYATTRMLRDNNLVRHLKACEVMGNATTICSDKTGTLTQNKMKVVSGTIGTHHRFGTRVSDNQDTADQADEEKPATTSPGDFSESDFTKKLCPDVRELLLKSIAINSTAFEGEVDGEKTFIGSKTEMAMLVFAKDFLAMGPVAEERSNVKVLQLIPFDSGRKCMGVVTQLDNGRARLYVKGASEIVLAKCTTMIRDPAKDMNSSELVAEDVEAVKTAIDSYASRSLRTIGIVYRDFETWPPPNAKRAEGGGIEFGDVFNQMTFVGMVGIQDPLRPGVPDAVKQCQRAGVVVRMVTGDNKLTAQAIATECGILTEGGLVMEGPEFRNLHKFQQNEIIPQLRVLARSSPEDKRILVRRLKDLGDVVAVTGDGTNDAPALKLADVGFSMGIAGTEVAKEASAIILMDDNFTSIVKALKWGRAVNDAVKRFLQFQLTVNVTAVILTFITAVSSTDEGAVLTAVQLLWLNLIMDTLAALALATDPPQESVLDRKPEPRGKSIISITMWKMILGQAVYQLAVTFTLYYAADKIGIVETPPPGQSASRRDTLVFNTFVWMQIFNQWNSRRLDNRFNIFEGLLENWFFIGINVVMCGAQVLIIYVGGLAFGIYDGKGAIQTGPQWAVAIILGLVSLIIGAFIRCIPDDWLRKCIPSYFRRRSQRLPGFTIEDEERFHEYPEVFTDVKDDLAFLKKFKGGRLTNLKSAVKHPREAIMAVAKSPSQSRSNSIRAPEILAQDENGAFRATTPDSRARSRSSRSRSNSALGATTVMAGIIAGSVATNWSPVERKSGERELSQASRQPSHLSIRADSEALAEETQATQEAQPAQSDVPRLSVPQPPSHKPTSSSS